MDIFRDSIWQFVGAVLGLIAIGVSIYIYSLQKGKKRLAFEVLSNSLLVNVDDNVKSEIQIFYKGKEIQDMGAIILRLSNKGTIPILANDFESPLQLSFGPDSKIVSSSYYGCKPKSLLPSITYTPERATIKPLLLNSGDSFTIKFIVIKHSGSLEVKGRIVGIGKIEDITFFPSDTNKTIIGVVALSLTLGLPIGAILAEYWGRNAVGIIGLVIFIIFLIYARKW